MFYNEGPGHGGQVSGFQIPTDGSYSEIYPRVSQDKSSGMKNLFTQFFLAGWWVSHASL